VPLVALACPSVAVPLVAVPLACPSVACPLVYVAPARAPPSEGHHRLPLHDKGVHLRGRAPPSRNGPHHQRLHARNEHIVLLFTVMHCTALSCPVL